MLNEYAHEYPDHSAVLSRSVPNSKLANFVNPPNCWAASSSKDCPTRMSAPCVFFRPHAGEKGGGRSGVVPGTVRSRSAIMPVTQPTDDTEVVPDIGQRLQRGGQFSRSRLLRGHSATFLPLGT